MFKPEARNADPRQVVEWLFQHADISGTSIRLWVSRNGNSKREWFQVSDPVSDELSRAMDEYKCHDFGYSIDPITVVLHDVTDDMLFRLRWHR
jgi:hypothetical protein